MLFDIDGRKQLFGAYPHDQPSAIETVLHRHVLAFSYHMLTALMPKVSKAVRLWADIYGRSTEPFVWCDADHYLTIFASSDGKRIIIAQESPGYASPTFPVAYLEGWTALAGRSFNMNDIARFEIHEAHNPDRDPQDDLHELRWFLDAAEAGPLAIAAWDSILSMALPEIPENTFRAYELRVTCDDSWHFKGTLDQLGDAMRMLDWAEEALSRDEDDEEAEEE